MQAELTREDVDQMSGPVVLEFGASWCGHCQALQPSLRTWLRAHARVRHIRIEDGRGKPLGRSFHIKLWPTLVVMLDGAVLSQKARPGSEELLDLLAPLDCP